MIVKLPADIVEKCREFAFKRADDSLALYKHRGEARRQKIFADIFYGTLAEFAVFLSLRPGSCSEPSLDLLEVKKKSFEPDLVYGKYRLHIKSQAEEQSEKYGLSWCFQRQDPLLIKPGDYDLIGLCTVLPDLSVQIQGFVLALGVKGRYKPLRVAQYTRTKLALYYLDVQDNIYTIWELENETKTGIQAQKSEASRASQSINYPKRTFTVGVSE